MRRSLSANLMISASLTLILAAFLVYGLWAVLVRFEPEMLQRSELSGMAARISRDLKFDAEGRPIASKVHGTMGQVLEALPLDVFYQVLDAQGAVLLTSNGERESLMPADRVGASEPTVFELARAGQNLHVIVLPIDRPQGRNFLLVARSRRFQVAMLENDGATSRLTAVIATLMALTVFAAVVLVTVNQLLRRLRDISAAAARIEPANFTARLAIDGVPKEIAPLIESFNSALARLERGYRTQQDFLATAAHELKTPIALMRGEIEMEGPADKTTILKDLDHMTRQVHQLLHLAEVSDDGNFLVSPLDAVRVVEDAIDFLSRLTQARNLVVDLQRPPEAVSIDADSGALFVLVRNLVENAAQHAPTHSTVKVSVDWDGISVRDHGTGIAEEDMPKVFNRFWRGAHRRDDGAGLGLSICLAIARAHGWTISAENAAPGAVFKVRFRTTEKSAEPLPGTSPRGTLLWHWLRGMSHRASP